MYPKYGATTAHYPHCDVIMVIGTLLYLEANGYQQKEKDFTSVNPTSIFTETVLLAEVWGGGVAGKCEFIKIMKLS